jgi:hypothetical protein
LCLADQPLLWLTVFLIYIPNKKRVESGVPTELESMYNVPAGHDRTCPVLNAIATETRLRLQSSTAGAGEDEAISLAQTVGCSLSFRLFFFF